MPLRHMPISASKGLSTQVTNGIGSANTLNQTGRRVRMRPACMPNLPMEWLQISQLKKCAFRIFKVLLCRAVLLIVPCLILNRLNSTKAPQALQGVHQTPYELHQHSERLTSWKLEDRRPGGQEIQEIQEILPACSCPMWGNHSQRRTKLQFSCMWLKFRWLT